MTHDDAVEFLDTNNVESGIRTAADAGAVIFAIMVNLENYENNLGAINFQPGYEFTSANKEVSTQLQEDSGIVIFSTSRQRNIDLLTDVENTYRPLGVVRYVSVANHLESRIRRSYEEDANLMCLLEEMATASLQHDPTLLAIVNEGAPRRAGVSVG
jgi:hypothetical protein